MIDVHTHILPFIDDGAEKIDESFAMIEKELSIGIKDIILTPHALRRNIKKYTKEFLLESFHQFNNQVKEKYNVNLYLGQEISYHESMISALKNNELLTINGSNYILLELPFHEEVSDFDELVFSCKVLGLKIIIAHVERYRYLDYDKIMDLRKYGVLFQVNSGSITGKNDKKIQKLVFKLIKNGFVEFVGSDVHSFRNNDMDEAYSIIKNKFNNEVAEKIFVNNPKELFKIK